MEKKYVGKMSGLLKNPKNVLSTKQDKMNQINNTKDMWDSISGGSLEPPKDDDSNLKTKLLITFNNTYEKVNNINSPSRSLLQITDPAGLIDNSMKDLYGDCTQYTSNGDIMIGVYDIILIKNNGTGVYHYELNITEEDLNNAYITNDNTMKVVNKTIEIERMSIGMIPLEFRDIDMQVINTNNFYNENFMIVVLSSDDIEKPLYTTLEYEIIGSNIPMMVLKDLVTSKYSLQFMRGIERCEVEIDIFNSIIDVNTIDNLNQLVPIIINWPNSIMNYM